MKFDVVIVGGGPAAATAALCLRRFGHSVGVIAAPRSKLKPTETAKPQLRLLLRDVGAESAMTCCEPCRGIFSDWGLESPSFNPSILSPFGNAWFVDRNKFDSHLEKLAKECGANWIESIANDAYFEKDSITVKTDSAIVSGKWLVIANGSLHWAGRVTKQTVIVKDSLIASWSLLNATLPERCLSTETCDSGWWYMCPNADGRAVACFVTDVENNRRLKPLNTAQWNKLFLQTRLSRMIVNFQPAASVMALRTGLAGLPLRHGRNWAAIGDAAAVLDPLGSSGTATAIESATRASAAIVAALHGDETRLGQYQEWSRNLFREFTRQRAAQYASEGRFRNSDFWNRRETVEPAATRPVELA